MKKAFAFPLALAASLLTSGFSSAEEKRVSLFNGKDLTGWKGLVGNPVSRSKMSEQELLLAEAAASTKAQQDWVVKDGLLIFTGHGDNLCRQLWEVFLYGYR